MSRFRLYEELLDTKVFHGVGLIFAEVAKRGGTFDDVPYAVVVFVVALTTLLAPIALRYIMRNDPET